MTHSPQRSPWTWIPTLYFAEGLPYTVVMLISVVFYKRMGVSNTDIALYTSWLYLPWVIKPFWSPVVEVFRTKRFWIISMQLLIGAGLGCVVLAIPSPVFFKLTLGFLWLLAFSSATHDIAADGFYMLGLSEGDQAWFVGIRSTFYRLAMISGQGLLIMFAGLIESHTGLADQKLEVFALHTQQIASNPIVAQKEDAENPLHLVVSTNQTELALKQIDQQKFHEFLLKVNKWNEKHSHATSFISDELPFFEELNDPPKKTVGNFEVVQVRLSKPPGDEKPIVVTMGQTSGDKGIRLVTEGRFEFSKDNWNVPFLAVVQHDVRMKGGGSAVFHIRSGNIRLAWSLSFLVLALLFGFFFFYHSWVLPKPGADTSGSIQGVSGLFREFFNVFISFFTKDRIILAAVFILLYRLGEAQLVKIAPLFMLGSMESGGLALSTSQYGFIYGTLGVLALTCGGICGGWVASRHGLKFWILWMALAMNVPDLVYVYLSYVQPDQLGIIAASVCIEQFGYGFGFTAYLLYMISVSDGPHKTAHYAICTGLMALGMMIPGMFSGWLQEQLGYPMFFVWVLIACLPGLFLIRYLKIEPGFGKKINSE